MCSFQSVSELHFQDLALGVAELHTAEALTSTESVMVGQHQAFPVSATSNDSDSSSEGYDYNDGSFKIEGDGNDESDDNNARTVQIKVKVKEKKFYY